MIKIVNLTAAQSEALGQVTPRYNPDLVVKTSRSSATLNGTAQECLTAIQDILNAIREEKGADAPEYRTLGSIRNRVHDFVTTGKTSYVNVVPNGASVNGDIPSVLSGAPVVQDAHEDDAPKVKGPGRPPLRRASARVVGRRMGTGSKPASEAPVTSDDVEAVLDRYADPDVSRPTFPQPEITPDAVENFRYMLKNAPNLWAENYWAGRVQELESSSSAT